MIRSMMTASLLLAPAVAIASGAASIADAERAFAARCAVVGIHQSFLEYFAPDAISFTPEPGQAMPRLRATPAPVQPRAQLVWGPEQTESVADLGWSTGPSIFTDVTAPGGKAIERYGYYVSLWRKQADGTWKVELDIGTDHTATATRTEIPKRAMSRDLKPTASKARPLDDLLSRDRAFCAAFEKSQSDALLAALARDARVHRDDISPMVGDAAWREWVGQLAGKASCKPIAARTSSDGGLGYTYGTWERAPSDGAAQTGAYVRVWRFDKRWVIAVDVATPYPENTAPRK